MPKKLTKSALILVASALAVVLVSVLVTLYFSGAFIGRASENRGYENITFTDAILSCEREVHEEFGSKLAQLVIDNHSSRFESELSLYKIFITVSVRSDNSQRIPYYINCYVRSSNGRLHTFNMFEDKGAPKTSAIKRKSEKLFNWPD